MIIRNHYCDLSNDVTFALAVRHDFHHYFGSLEKNDSHNVICVHYILEDPPYEYQNLVMLICLHQILHVIHPEWDKDRVYAKCRELASLVGYLGNCLISSCSMSIILQGSRQYCSGS